MHLKYVMEAADAQREGRYPQAVIRSLGITYRHKSFHQMPNVYYFWNCKNVPSDLPTFISIYNDDPMELVDEVLSEQEAQEIRSYQDNQQKKP